MQPCPILLNWYTYFLGFLVTREDPASYGSREQRELQLRHLGWVRLTIGKGRFRVAGPIMDGSGLGGATIITAEPVAAAEFGEKLTLQSKRVTSTSVRIPLFWPDLGHVRVGRCAECRGSDQNSKPAKGRESRSACPAGLWGRRIRLRRECELVERTVAVAQVLQESAG